MYIYVLFSFLNYSQSFDIGKTDGNSVEPGMLVRIMLNIAEIGGRNTVYVILINL